jgi:hypothetical protein
MRFMALLKGSKASGGQARRWLGWIGHVGGTARDSARRHPLQHLVFSRPGIHGHTLPRRADAHGKASGEHWRRLGWQPCLTPVAAVSARSIDSFGRHAKWS